MSTIDDLLQLERVGQPQSSNSTRKAIIKKMKMLLDESAGSPDGKNGIGRYYSVYNDICYRLDIDVTTKKGSSFRKTLDLRKIDFNNLYPKDVELVEIFSLICFCYRTQR